MPPLNPAFLPRQPRRLDPTRHLKSRELWNQVRFHASAPPTSDNNNSNSNSNSGVNKKSKEYYLALLQAILYEIQPFRIKPFFHQLHMFLFQEDGLQTLLSTISHYTSSLLSLLHQSSIILYHHLRQIDLESTKTFYQTNHHLLTRGTLSLSALYAYYHLVLYLHELLHAGPMIVILTAFVLLYTIGLGDNTGAGSGIPSAYSVFNRGMQRILGTVDGEELARQYAGGVGALRAGVAAAGGGHNPNHHWNDDNHDDDDEGGVWVVEEEEDYQDNEQNIVRERRRRRRLERLGRRVDDNPDNENNNNNIQAEDQDDNEDNLLIPEDEEGDNDDAMNGNGAADNHQNGNYNVNGVEGAGARKSGKKARRRNLELRREMQRQRQAAQALGFGAGDIDDANVAGLDVVNG